MLCLAFYSCFPSLYGASEILESEFGRITKYVLQLIFSVGRVIIL